LVQWPFSQRAYSSAGFPSAFCPSCYALCGNFFLLCCYQWQLI
jgi:hypothetical protein